MADAHPNAPPIPGKSTRRRDRPSIAELRRLAARTLQAEEVADNLQFEISVLNRLVAELCRRHGVPGSDLVAMRRRLSGSWAEGGGRR